MTVILRLIFVIFLGSLNLVNFGSTSTKHIDTGYLVNATSPTILARRFFQILKVFLSMPEYLHVILRLFFAVER